MPIRYILKQVLIVITSPLHMQETHPRSFFRAISQEQERGTSSSDEGC